ncbi:MAG: GGDEF domain-containing protein [Chloroflexota bacterium]|nr:GGDEF domain-containing protein [Chloroflexota bacterium]
MDRSGVRSLAIAGARLLTALLPLLALGALRLFPEISSGTLQDWVEPSFMLAAMAACGAALILLMADALRSGRVRTLADATGLGLVGVTLAAITLDGSTLIAAAGALVAGVSAAGVVFLAGSLLGAFSADGPRGRIAGVVASLVAIQATLVLVLLAGGMAIDDRILPLLLLGPAVLLGLAAVTSSDAPARAVALGLAATATLAQAFATPGIEMLPGMVGLVLAAAVLGVSAGLRLRGEDQAPALPPAFPVTLPLPLLPPSAPVGLLEARADAEDSEPARLARELRATLEELITTRRTVGMQRAEIERASAVDQLTGVASRAAVLERLRLEAAEARRYDHPLAVVLLDVDDFAALNHLHGTATGDTVLREVALRLRLRAREADALGRIAADAFLAILPHTDELGAIGFADAVRNRLSARPILTDAGEMPITLSVGIALMRPGAALSEDELLAAAEEALASARAAGGNVIAFDRAHGLARIDDHRGPPRTPEAEPEVEDDGTR